MLQMEKKTEKELWYHQENQGYIVKCKIYMDFRDTLSKCPLKHMCDRIDRGNYPDFCKQ